MEFVVSMLATCIIHLKLKRDASRLYNAQVGGGVATTNYLTTTIKIKYTRYRRLWQEYKCSFVFMT